MADENVCLDCGYEGPEGPGEGRCPMCGGEMTSMDDLDEELEEEVDEEDVLDEGDGEKPQEEKPVVEEENEV